MTFHQHQQASAIETVFVMRDAKQAAYELNILKAYGF